MSALDTLGKAASIAGVVLDLANAVEKIPDAVTRISQWINGGGDRPDDVLALPELTDMTREHLELAALVQRSAAADAAKTKV